MNDKVAISVADLHKEFILPQHKITTIKQAFVNIGKKNEKVKQNVLNGVDFQINKGDFFGIVGKNGSGKSTLLKILAGVYSPTSGQVERSGELTPFIELGVGFNPELSGRDNVFLNASLLGFSRAETRLLYDDIVEFSELKDSMDKKLKNYSSGMQVRLAFAIAVKARNDILIFDEVLAVGDEAFQSKCLDIFEKYKAAKQTVVLVTHNMETVRRFCNRAMLLDNGKILEIGEPRKVSHKYSKLNDIEIDKMIKNDSDSSDKARYLEARIKDKNNNTCHRFSSGDKIKIEVSWKGLDSSQLESLGVNIFKRTGEHITGFNSRYSLKEGWKEKEEISLDINLNITDGRYYLMIEAFREPGKVIDAIYEGPDFDIDSSEDKGLKWSGLVDLPHKWSDAN